MAMPGFWVTGIFISPKKARKTMRNVYRPVRKAPAIPAAQSNGPPGEEPQAWCRIRSLL